jgi:thymidylate synthase (FAD)
MEKIMTSTPILVDTHGYVKFIEAWGTGEAGTGVWDHDKFSVDYECGIIEAARQSTQACFRGWEEDQKLLDFLYNNRPKHTGPFEFAGMTVEIQAPIFVFREWHRHRTQSYNEMSARYAPLPDLYFMPVLDDVMERAHVDTRNKQAKGLPGTNLTENNARLWLDSLDAFYAQAESLYHWALQIGIPKELARVSMPVGHYSRMRATGNLLNWIRFLTLRTDPNAQAEIRRYAHAVGSIIGNRFPRTWFQFRLEQDSK